LLLRKKAWWSSRLFGLGVLLVVRVLAQPRSPEIPWRRGSAHEAVGLAPGLAAVGAGIIVHDHRIAEGVVGGRARAASP